MSDLVVISLEAWDQVWRRNQHLVAGLLRADPALRVLFVAPPADPMYAVRSGRAPRPGRGVVAVDDLPGVGAGRLWTLEATKWLPRRLHAGGDARLAAQILRATTELEMRRPVLWVNDPVAGAVVLEATGWPALYDVTDDWLLAERSPREHERLVVAEARLLRDCAEVVVCSPTLAASKGATRGSPSSPTPWTARHTTGSARGRSTCPLAAPSCMPAPSTPTGWTSSSPCARPRRSRALRVSS